MPPRRTSLAPGIAVSRAATSPPVSDSASPRRETLDAQQVEHDRLHRLAVDAEHERPELAAQRGLPLVEHRRRRAGVGPAGRDAHVQAVPAPGEEGDRRVAGLVECGDDAVEAFVEPALALAPRVQDAAGDDRRLAGPGPQVRQHGPLEHVVHLVRDAWNGVDRPCRRPGRSTPAPCPRVCGMTVAPTGTSAWRRLFSGIVRPRAANSSRITAAIAGSGTRSTPIRAAMASRVTSSCVGPRPPVTITASASSSRRRSAAVMRPTLSPTLTWVSEAIPLSASCSPIHAELVSWICPSSSSVPTARTSHRMGGLGLRRHGRDAGTPTRSRRRAPRPATGTRSTATSRRPRSTAAGRTRRPTAGPASCSWPSVLAGTLTPCDPTTVRYMLMTNSRTAMIATGTIQNTPLPTSVNIAPSTRTLSASGSRNAPDLVAPWRRAM